MASVRFNLRKNTKKDPHIQLVYRLESDNKKLVYGTDLHVPLKYWNAKKMRIQVTKEFPECEIYNSILDKWESTVLTIKNRFHLEGIQPSLIEFRKAIKREFVGNDSTSNEKDYISYYKKYLENKKKSSATVSTIKQYQNALNLFQEFVSKKESNKKIEFRDMTKSLLLNFINFLEKEKRHQQNTINKTIKRHRAVLNEATSKGLNTLLDFRDKDCQRKYVKQPKICVFESEMQQIINLDLEAKSRLDKIRDTFIVGFYTALRFEDLILLRENHITSEFGRDVIQFRANKVSGFVSIPLKPIVKTILDKYDGKIPKISLQNFNSYLKELCKKAGIDVNVSREEDGMQVIYKKWQLVSSHTMRRSFATNAILNGINPEFVRKITGHSSLKQLYEYVVIDSREFLDFAAENKYFQ